MTYSPAILAKAEQMTAALIGQDEVGPFAKDAVAKLIAADIDLAAWVEQTEKYLIGKKALAPKPDTKPDTFGGSIKQYNLIVKLLGEKVVPAKQTDWWKAVVAGTTSCTGKQASQFIDGLFKCPKVGTPGKIADEGYYLMDGTVYRVRKAKTTGNHYAVQLVITTTVDGKKKGTWEYVKGVVYKLGEIAPMTVEEAAAKGHLDGVCVVCGRALTEPKSVQAGIGPVCAKKL